MKDFFEYLEEQKLTLTVPVWGDGSYELDDVDVSWGFEAIKDVEDDERIWTVLDCDGELIIVHGYSRVNRMYYLVTDQPHHTEIEEFEF